MVADGLMETFECEELNQVEVPDWGDSIYYAANRRPDALEEATRKAFQIVREWNDGNTGKNSETQTGKRHL